MMEPPEKKSNWDDLARELGASEAAEKAAPIAPAAVPGSSAEPRPALHEPSTAPRPPARPKSSANDWDNLAVGLGIAPLPEAPPTPAVSSRPQEGSRVEDATPAASKPREAPRATERAEQSQVEDSKPEVRTPAPSGAVSLWHKIFGSPAEQAQKIAEVETGRESPPRPAADRPREARQEHDERRGSRRGRRDDRDADRGADAAERTDSWNAELPEAAAEDTGEESRIGTTETDEPRRGRRRRRRGGRGRRRDGDTGEAHAPAKRTERPEEDRTRRTDSGTRRGEDVWAQDSRDGIADEDILEDVMAEPDGGDETELDTGETGAEPAGRTAASRNIPSWEEAIGFIVETNLSTRSERRRAAPQGSRGSSSRGGRSRRRRGGKKQ